MATMSIRREIDGATGELDTEVDVLDQMWVARDALDAAPEKHLTLIAKIPPIALGRTTYRVVTGGSYGLEIVGPRGGHSTLVRNQNYPDQWAHVTMAGLKARTTWYLRNADGTFTRI